MKLKSKQCVFLFVFRNLAWKMYVQHLLQFENNAVAPGFCYVNYVCSQFCSSLLGYRVRRVALSAFQMWNYIPSYSVDAKFWSIWVEPWHATNLGWLPSCFFFISLMLYGGEYCAFEGQERLFCKLAVSTPLKIDYYFWKRLVHLNVPLLFIVQ